MRVDISPVRGSLDLAQNPRYCVSEFPFGEAGV
jgi:hypothetical protein